MRVVTVRVVTVRVVTEKQAICNYIDCLDKINLAVRAEFVTDAANYVLKH